MTANHVFRSVAARRLELGEGARAMGDGFVFVDLLEGRLVQLGPSGAPKEVAQLDVPLGAVAPLQGGGWVAAAGTGFALLRDGFALLRDNVGDGVTWLHRPEDGAATPMRMNDGVADPHGRFWAGSMAYDGTPGAGSLYRLDPDLTLTRVLGGLTIPNGPAFNATGNVMYLADSAVGEIYRYRVDVARGEVGPRSDFARVDDASPDGMTVDAEGFLWCALWGGHRLHRYAPDGELERSVPVPASQPTSVALSSTTPGSILVTTATYGLESPVAEDGRVLRATTDIRGLEPGVFAHSRR